MVGVAVSGVTQLFAVAAPICAALAISKAAAELGGGVNRTLTRITIGAYLLRLPAQIALGVAFTLAPMSVILRWMSVAPYVLFVLGLTAHMAFIAMAAQAVRSTRHSNM